MELLAPAGDLASALAAFDGGADAVYAGLRRFSARARADNMNVDEMARLTAYAHGIGKKVYAAFNTLVKESEIAEAAALVAELRHTGVDALIVQDLGVTRLIRDWFPDLPLHGSTQMCIHNSAGLRTAARLGLTRVILERQTTLEEIALMAKTSPVEIEIFAHGALCSSLSGNCLFSSWIGGHSGNRGRCKQPCRWKFSQGPKNGFIFSTSDLCLLRSIPQARRIGVKALKIEGRLRHSDYVRSVVAAYRLALDATEGGFADAVRKAEEILQQSFGRTLVGGFQNAEAFKSVIQPQTIGVAGLRCGAVSRLLPNGFEVLLEKRLHIGDKIRVQDDSGDEGVTVTVSNVSVNGESVKSALRGVRCVIKTDKPVPCGAAVYKIGETVSSSLSRLSSMRYPKTKLDLDTVVAAGSLTVTVKNVEGAPTWTGVVETSEARNRPLAAETLAAEFEATRSELFALGAFSARVEGNLFLPASALKEVRRQFWEWAGSILTPAEVVCSPFRQLRDFLAVYEQEKNAVVGSIRTTIAETTPQWHPPDGIHVFATEVEKASTAEVEAILPSFISEKDIGEVRKVVRKAYAAGVRKFRVTSLHGFDLLAGMAGVEISTSYPLGACNSLAVNELRNLGATMVQAWIELEKAELLRLQEKADGPLELYQKGRPPLLVTRFETPTVGRVLGSNSEEFQVAREYGGLTVIRPVRAMELPELPDFSTFEDAEAKGRGGGTGSFNFDRKFH